MDERMIVGPDPLDDLHSWIVTMGVNGDESSAGSECASERRDHALGLEFERRARPVRLRSDHQVVIGLCATRPRNDRIEQEAMIFAIEHEDDRAFVDWIAGAGAYRRFPILTQERLKADDLLLELVRRIAEQRQLVPN